jgi:hypothetical protein
MTISTRIQLISFAAASALSLFATADLASANESNITRLGPVGPGEPLSINVGASRLVAYYERDGGNCSVSAVLAPEADDSFASATQLSVALRPGEIMHVDGTENHRVVLACAPKAEALFMLNKVDPTPSWWTKALY